MTPAQIAMAMHENTPGVGFADAMAAHLSHGLILSTATAFVMARPVRDWQQMADPWQAHPGSALWYVWAAAGDLGELLAFLASRPEISALVYHRHGRRIFRHAHEIRKFQRRPEGSRGQPQAVAAPIQPADETDGEAAEGSEATRPARTGADGSDGNPLRF
jgi:hypothetical protein